METTKPEKVYVAIGTDWYEGFSTLQWTLRKWSNQAITIVILHAANTLCRDYVYTPLGKLPRSSVNEEKIKALEKSEEAMCDKIMSQYIASCGKVKAEVIKLEKNDQPIQKQMIDIISRFQITKLVMSFTVMKSSSWKSRSAISGSFYVLRQKPDFCEMFVICGGRLVFLNDEGFVEDDKGFMVAKVKERNYSFKNWIGKMFNDNSVPNSPSSSRSNGSSHQWLKYSEEIETYVNELLSLHDEEGEINVGNTKSKENSIQLNIPENMEAAERTQILKRRIEEARDAIQSNKKQANSAKERHKKAEWAIDICNTRAEELKPCISEEVVRNIDLKKELDSKKEELNELQSVVEEKRSNLSSILELQKELTNKLHLSSSAKSRVEVQLEKSVRARADMVLEIEELRKQRDVLNRRIEFCREKDSIEKVLKLDGFGFEYREFSAEEIIAATEDFSERLRLKSEGQLTNVYRGRINHITVAVKTCISTSGQSEKAFKTKVQRLGQIRHPNILAMIGFCSELNCIVFEYMQNGSLNNTLFSKGRNSKRKNPPLSWHARISIAAEMCSALSFLHEAKPNPITHGNLNSSKILLDRHNVAKIDSFDVHSSTDELDIKSDIRDYGNLLLQLLTGKKWDVIMDTDTVSGCLDHLAGEWPMDLAKELCGIAIRCLSCNNAIVEESITAMPVTEINDVRKRADQLVANGEFPMPVEDGFVEEESSNVPSAFLCPIYQDVMQNPHLAADGFSYELEAIDEWLKTGSDTSPMTNLRLKHKLLTPNHTLRSLIQDWQNKRSVAPN